MAMRRALGLVTLLPAAIVVGIWIAMIPNEGGYFARDWYPAALTLLGLLVASAFGSGRVLPAVPRARGALLLLAGLVAFSYLSLLWAEAGGDAWDEANLLLLYLLGAWVLALVPWDAHSAAALLGAWAVGVAVMCALALLEVLDAANLGPFFFETRYQHPIGYPNALSALGAVGLWPALLLASRRGASIPAQALFMAVAVFLAEVALLPQSRGFMVGTAVVAVVALAIFADRARLLARLLVWGGLVAVALGPILEVADAVQDERPVSPVLHDAAEWMALTVGLAIAATVALALVVEPRVRLPSVPTHTLRRIGVAAAALTVIAAGGVAIAKHDRISDSVQSRWDQFTTGEGPDDEGPRLFSSEPYQRYDLWQVALDAFADAPLGGVGAGNFDRRYSAERHFKTHSNDPHSIWMRALSETGIVGAALLVGFVLVGFGGAVRFARRLDGRTGAVAVGCVAVTTYYLVHGSLDWLEKYPVLAGPAIGFVFVALALGGRPDPPRSPPGLPGRLLHGLAGAAVIAAGVGLALPYVSLRYLERGRDAWAAAPAAAFSDIGRAQDWNPLAVEPLLSEGLLALELRDNDRARATFREVLKKEENWVAYFELALIEASERRWGAAELLLAQASALNERDSLIVDAKRRISKRRDIVPAEINREVLSLSLHRFRLLS